MRPLLALWTVAAAGIPGGRTPMKYVPLLKYVPLRLITRVAAVAMPAPAATSLYAAFTG